MGILDRVTTTARASASGGQTPRTVLVLVPRRVSDLIPRRRSQTPLVEALLA
jgi:hypothetical protein